MQRKSAEARAKPEWDGGSEVETWRALALVQAGWPHPVRQAVCTVAEPSEPKVSREMYTAGHQREKVCGPAMERCARASTAKISRPMGRTTGRRRSKVHTRTGRQKRGCNCAGDGQRGRKKVIAAKKGRIADAHAAHVDGKMCASGRAFQRARRAPDARPRRGARRRHATGPPCHLESPPMIESPPSVTPSAEVFLQEDLKITFKI